ncbi:hypothetical protein ABVK25_003132 [Lepraria finkii]|uniref:CENP-V/GFA domain-containing protein n=1 Tax=Lepraria finkii TaxID=1340010 RepID=A0ABR4BLA2_9LECA
MLPDGTTDLQFEGPIVDYKSSKTVTRSFCDHCGANVYFFQDSNNLRPDVCTGIFDRADGVLELRNHIFLPDTKDDGLTVSLSDITAFDGYSTQSKPIEYQKSDRAKSGKDQAIELQAYCQCRGVQFKVSRPENSSRTMASP